MNIAVVGTGYVGLVSSVCLAYLGHDVVGIDIDEDKIATIAGGDPGIFEDGLDELLESELAGPRLRFSSKIADASEADLLLIAVGTPQRASGDADLSAVFAVARSAAEHLKSGAAVVTKSTVPTGTGAAIRAILDEQGRNDVAVGSNPEFLRQGTAVDNFLNPDRIVIGANDPATKAMLEEMFRPLVEQGFPLISTDVATAELIKYAANAFLATKLAYVNEMADLCEVVGARIEDVTQAVGLDDRISPSYMEAGPGFGGSCLPKDAQALLHTFAQAGTHNRMVTAAIDSNRARRARLSDRVIAAHGSTPGKVAVWGLTFKAGTDDLRESPAIDLVNGLAQSGIKVVIHDPQLNRLPESINAETAPTPLEAASDADVVVVATGWTMYTDIDLNDLATQMRGTTVVDFRNTLASEDVISAGLSHHPIGRPSEVAQPV